MEIRGASMAAMMRHASRTAQSENKPDASMEETNASLAAEDEAPAAMLQRFEDSRDEMSAAMSLFRNRRDLEKRKGVHEGGNLERVLDEEAEGKVTELVRVIQNDNRTSIALLLQQFRSMFPDDSDLVLILREMLHEESLGEVEKKRLTELLMHVERNADPKRLKAGINVALKARLFGRSLDFSPALLRESYRDFISSDAPEIDIYQEWIACFGSPKRQIVVNFIEDALVADMQSLDPSCSQTEFGEFLRRFSQIKNIRSGDINFTERLSGLALCREAGIGENDLLLFMFSMVRHCWQIEQSIDELFRQKYFAGRHQDFAAFLQVLHLASRTLPSSLFRDESDREVADETFRRIAEPVRKAALRETEQSDDKRRKE